MYVFDIDGVLVDPSERIKVAMIRSRINDIHKEKLSKNFWKIFLSEDLLSLDKPREIGISLLKDRENIGEVIIVTGRPLRLKRATINELKSFGINFKKIRALLMRRNNDFRYEWIVKPELLKGFLKKPEILEIHDDSERTLREYSKYFPGAKLFLHSPNGYCLLA